MLVPSIPGDTTNRLESNYWKGHKINSIGARSCEYLKGSPCREIYKEYLHSFPQVLDKVCQ